MTVHQWLDNARAHQAAQSLLRGDVIAYPTEAVWGLGCLPESESGIRTILSMKTRAPSKGLIMVAAHQRQLGALYSDLTDEQKYRLDSSWPGPNTWLIPDPKNRVSPWIKGDHSAVAVRVSAHTFVAALCILVGGPIISTSANPQGASPARHQWQVMRYFRQFLRSGELSVVAPGRVGSSSSPSQIRDLVSGDLIRPGG